MHTMRRSILTRVWIISCLAMTAAAPEVAQGQSAEPVGDAARLPDLVQKLKPSICTILVYDADDKPIGQGTGFFIGEGRVITNHHVVQDAHRAELKLASGEVVPVRGVFADDETYDLVMLAVSAKQGDPPAIPLGKKLPREGERIIVIGSPLGLEQSVSQGIVSSVRDMGVLGKKIQITAAISAGSSGSPVLNTQGRVVAVASSQIVSGQSLNFAVPVESVRALKTGNLRTLAEWSSGESKSLNQAFILGVKASG